MYSEVLKLEFHVVDESLRIWNPRAEAYLETVEEMEQSRLQERRARLQERRARLQAEQRQLEERKARLEAERRLEELLRRANKLDETTHLG